MDFNKFYYTFNNILVKFFKDNVVSLLCIILRMNSKEKNFLSALFYYNLKTIIYHKSNMVSVRTFDILSAVTIQCELNSLRLIH